MRNAVVCGEGLPFQAPKATVSPEFQVTVRMRPMDELFVSFCVLPAQTLPLSCSAS